MKIIPESRNREKPANPLWDNTDLLAKIFYRWKSHRALFVKALNRGVSMRSLVVTRFPYKVSDHPIPPSIHVEFTNACYLKCVYCNNPHFGHPRSMMSDETFSALIRHLKKSAIDRICIGGGEATLHPAFVQRVHALAEISRLLTIVTNGQWKNSEIPTAMVTAPVDFIEVSVESGSPEDYATVRIGGNHSLLIENLKELRTLRKKYRSRSMINLRLMVRPSQRGAIERESLSFWKKFADYVMPQYVLKIEGVDTISDVFMPRPMQTGGYPKCTLPFRNLQVRCNGDVPVCQISGNSLDSKKRLIAGNIQHNTIIDIWNNDVFKSYRMGHRLRKHELIPICRGCKGC